MENKLNISNRLKKALNDSNITQKEVCLYINIAPSTFNNWINMNRSIPAEFVIPICEFLNIDVYWLLTGQNNKCNTSQLDIKEIPLELSVDEDNLLDLYQNTTTDGQKIIQKTVRKIWAENQRPKIKLSQYQNSKTEDEISSTKQLA